MPANLIIRVHHFACRSSADNGLTFANCNRHVILDVSNKDNDDSNDRSFAPNDNDSNNDDNINDNDNDNDNLASWPDSTIALDISLLSFSPHHWYL